MEDEIIFHSAEYHYLSAAHAGTPLIAATVLDRKKWWSDKKTDAGILRTDAGIFKTDVGILKIDAGIFKTDVGI